jgi:16S rRNA (guanine(1405)-N(7))-methyltransferase
MKTLSKVEEIVSTVSRSKKYRTVCADTIRRIAERELTQRDSLKAATKATKRRLHQAYGAFQHDFDHAAAYQRLAAAYKTGSDTEIRAACRHVLGLHSSTQERLAILDQFYPAIMRASNQPTSILDLGCGLNPLAIPWMELPSSASYVALDIDADRIGFLNRYLVLAGLEPLARCQDLLARPPQDAVDLALLLKMSPTLERQQEGATLRLLDHLKTPVVVVSFAVKSLGGREKGMVAHYQRQFTTWIEGRTWSVERLVFDSELAFVVKK